MNLDLSQLDDEAYLDNLTIRICGKAEVYTATIYSVESFQSKDFCYRETRPSDALP